MDERERKIWIYRDGYSSLYVYLIVGIPKQKKLPHGRDMVRRCAQSRSLWELQFAPLLDPLPDWVVLFLGK